MRTRGALDMGGHQGIIEASMRRLDVTLEAQ